MNSTTRAIRAPAMHNAYTAITQKSLWVFGALFKVSGMLSMIAFGTLAVINFYFLGFENSRANSLLPIFPASMLCAILGGKLLAYRREILNPTRRR